MMQLIRLHVFRAEAAASEQGMSRVDVVEGGGIGARKIVRGERRAKECNGGLLGLEMNNRQVFLVWD